jgi:hypothetical protein
METIRKQREEMKQLKEAAKRLTELETAEAKRKEAEMTELQKLQAQLEATNKALHAKELAEARRAAADKVGLPAALANRLQGETPEELEADAQALLDTLPKPQPTEPAKPKSPGIVNPGANGSTQETYAQQKARIQGSSIDPFDPETAKRFGGGVFHTE